MIDLCAIRKIQVALRDFEERLKEKTGLTLNEAMCLCALQKGMEEPSILASEMQLSPSRLTRILDVMETKDLISRSGSKADRRSVSITLTEEGKRLLEAYHCSDITMPELIVNQ